MIACVIMNVCYRINHTQGAGLIINFYIIPFSHFLSPFVWVEGGMQNFFEVLFGMLISLFWLSVE